MDRTQSLWVYLPASAAHGMYWYNLFTYQLSFSAVRVNQAGYCFVNRSGRPSDVLS